MCFDIYMLRHVEHRFLLCSTVNCRGNAYSRAHGALRCSALPQLTTSRAYRIILYLHHLCTLILSITFHITYSVCRVRTGHLFSCSACRKVKRITQVHHIVLSVFVRHCSCDSRRQTPGHHAMMSSLVSSIIGHLPAQPVHIYLLLFIAHAECVTCAQGYLISCLACRKVKYITQVHHIVLSVFVWRFFLLTKANAVRTTKGCFKARTKRCVLITLRENDWGSQNLFQTHGYLIQKHEMPQSFSQKH